MADANITTAKDGKFKATAGGKSETFDTFSEAERFVEDNTPGDGQEPAASEMTPEDAEAINSDVNPAPVPEGATEGGASLPQDDSNDNGAGNREAPHQTKESANDDGRTD